jgi:spoIIIJ-associated protein
VEEATKKALAQLRVGLNEVEITVLNSGKSGILGIGAEDSKIRVKLLKENSTNENSDIEIVKNVLIELLEKMGFTAEVEVIKPEKAFDEEGETSPVIFNIRGDDHGVLIGRRGQTLEAIQYLVRLITSKKTSNKLPIMIDVENYKRHRYDDLRVLATNIAQQVKTSKMSFKLEPMPAFERRIVHMALADDADVMTESTGEGEFRKVVIIPKNRKY